MSKRVLYLQITEPGAYPPLINSSLIFTENGWDVLFLSAPIKGKNLRINDGKGIKDIRLKERSSHIVSKTYLIYYIIASIFVSLKFRPTIIYVSDPISSIPVFFASFFGIIKIVYHEHDSPNSHESLNTYIRSFRKWVFTNAKFIVFPNENRAKLAIEQLNINFEKVKVIWNLPLGSGHQKPWISKFENERLFLHFHGSINKERLPEEFIKAISEYDGQIKLNIYGYEAPSAIGYVNGLIEQYGKDNQIIQFHGSIANHSELLKAASASHIGVSFMPKKSEDVNMTYMLGASNKVFEYLSVGLYVIFTDLDDWKETFEKRELGISCNPEDHFDIRRALNYIFANRIYISRRSQFRMNIIEENWNYRMSFKKLLNEL